MYIAVRTIFGRNTGDPVIIGISPTYDRIKEISLELASSLIGDGKVELYHYKIDEFYKRKYIGSFFTHTKKWYIDYVVDEERDILHNFACEVLKGDPMACDMVRDILKI
jgi:hypothetical protein